MTTEFPLSALDIMALFSLSLDFMEFIGLTSVCVSCVGFELFSCKVYMRSATIFLQASLSLVGSCAMAVSVSNPRFCIQFHSLACML